MIAPVKKAEKKILFHSCGMIGSILEDLKKAGIDAIWPQLPLFDCKELSYFCRELGLAVQIHLDRANLMTYGSPSDVRAAVGQAVEIFKPYEGGSWFYVEADNGFPYENIEALISEINKYR